MIREKDEVKVVTNEESNKSVLQAPPRADGQLPADGDGQADGPVDEASASVSSALRTSFLALKIVLLFLVVSYLGSGYFTLQAGQKAVVVQFGQIQGEGTAAGPVLTEGAHWSWPWPVSQKIIENTEKTRALPLDSFWFYIPLQLRSSSMDEILAKASAAPDKLEPGMDGYLLTGEQEIVHLKCEIRYKIDDLVKYVTNVNNDVREMNVPGEPRPMQMPGDEYLIRVVAEWAGGQTVAAMRTDEVILGDDARLRGRIKQLMQQRLDSLDSGIGIVDVQANWRSVPLQVRPKYLEVVQAENKKAEAIANARRDATQKLYEAAGPTHEELATVIREYDLARTLGDAAQAEVKMQRVMELLDQAGGMVAHTIVSARAESSRRTQQIRAEISRFRKAYPQYLRNPALFMAQYWADTKQQILTSRDIERIYMPAGSKEIRLNLGHNPDFLRQSQIRKYTEQTQGQ